MEAMSISRYIRQSPKKVRIVLDKIRGKKVIEYARNLFLFVGDLLFIEGGSLVVSCCGSLIVT